MQIRFIFLHPDQQEFPDDRGDAVLFKILAQMQKAAVEIGFGEKCQGTARRLLVGNVQKTEEFQFVDESFLAFFGPFGDGVEPTGIMTEQGDDDIGFAVIDAVQDNGIRYPGLCRHRLEQQLFRKTKRDLLLVGIGKIMGEDVEGKFRFWLRWKEESCLYLSWPGKCLSRF